MNLEEEYLNELLKLVSALKQSLSNQSDLFKPESIIERRFYSEMVASDG